MSLVEKFRQLTSWGATNKLEDTSLNLDRYTHVNITRAQLQPVEQRDGAQFLLAREKNVALLGILKRSQSVLLDRTAGQITIDYSGQTLTGESLQIAAERYLKKDNKPILRIALHSALADKMSQEHKERIESLFHAATSNRKGANYSAGVISLASSTRPYSRAGQPSFKKLPQTIEHGDYAFFTPGFERLDTVCFLAGLASKNHAILPSITLSTQSSDPNSRNSVGVLWHLVDLDQAITSELQKKSAIDRFYDTIFYERKNLSSHSFDLKTTVLNLASSLGLDTNEIKDNDSAEEKIMDVIDCAANKTAQVTIQDGERLFIEWQR